MVDTDKPVFAAAMAQLCVAMREKDPDAVQMRVYFQALKNIEIEFVAGAVDVLAQRAQFFPKPSEWRDAARGIEQERVRQMGLVVERRRHRGLDPLCSVCEDTGFAMIENLNRVASCDCRKLRRLEVLGRRPFPLLPAALPAAGESDQSIQALALARSAVKVMR